MYGKEYLEWLESKDKKPDVYHYSESWEILLNGHPMIKPDIQLINLADKDNEQ